MLLPNHQGSLLTRVFPHLLSEVCSVDCGTHGVCMGGACRCEDGWTGAGCDQRVCNPLCIKHGTCKDGKCQCHQGWNGEHCTIGQHLHVSVCVCVHVWVRLVCVCLSASWVCTGTQGDVCDSYFAPHSGNLDMRKADHRGFAKEGWREGLEGSVWAWGSSYPLSLWEQKHTKKPLPEPLGITAGHIVRCFKQ